MKSAVYTTTLHTRQYSSMDAGEIHQSRPSREREHNGKAAGKWRENVMTLQRTGVKNTQR